MTRTDLDAATLAKAIRRMAGDGSIEWVMEPIQADVLRDVADMLDENAKLHGELEQWHSLTANIELPEYPVTQFQPKDLERENAKLRELVRDMYKSMDVSCQFGHAIPAGTMAHIKNRVIGLGVEVE